MSQNCLNGKKNEILFGGKVKKYLTSIFEANDTINSLITLERFYRVNR